MKERISTENVNTTTLCAAKSVYTILNEKNKIAKYILTVSHFIFKEEQQNIEVYKDNLYKKIWQHIHQKICSFICIRVDA